MASPARGPDPLGGLLARAHSPSSADRIFRDKIQHRSLQLRPSSPPPGAALDARSARRRARDAARAGPLARPKPLSSRQRRQLGLDLASARGHRYASYEPLHALWQGYAREVLGKDLWVGGPAAAAKLASLELQGAETEVVRSRCPSRVGVRGIVVRDGKFVLELVTRTRGRKVVPKEGTVFRLHLPPEPADSAGGRTEDGPGPDSFVFDLLGDQLMLRSADRSNRKFKAHFLPGL